MENKKKILIINSGGTICMSKTDGGYAPDLKVFRDSLEKLAELSAPEMPTWEMINLEPLLDSSNIAVDEWNKIGKVIEENYDKYDGFVILHGTDTMAYTASILSFALENLGKPVIITGAQIPLCELRSDGKDNLITSLMLAASDRIFEVGIYFANKLFRGNCTIKFSASDFIAFNSPNLPPLATAGIHIDYNDSLLLPKPTKPFRRQVIRKVPIGVIKVFPGIQFGLFERIMTEDLKGIVVETFGAGNIPNSSGSALLPIIEKAYKNGSIITVCTQCPQGTVMLGTYQTSAALKSVGAVAGREMTTEAAVAKLYYLFSKDLTPDEVRIQMETPLRGEESYL
ncbi:MAG: asparaginase domain-containing protein [Bacilli bacterium]|nr:asparaginase domain-containing protein [Bacilli bacterium]